MKKKIFNLFLIFIMIIAIVGCGKNEKTTDKGLEKEPIVEINNNDALLWEVKSDTATIYLAGSIHVATEDTYPLQQKLLNAFNSSDALAVEIDVVALQEESESMYELASLMIYSDGTTLEDHVSEKTLNLFKEYVEDNGISGIGIDYIDTLYLYKPWALSNFISTDLVSEAKMNSELGIDMYFLNEAKEKNIEIIEVESAEFQYNMMNSYSSDLQELLLYSTIATPKEDSIQELVDLLEIWEKGDVVAFEEYVNSEELDNIENLTKEELKLYEKLMKEYNDAMIVNRNIDMANKVEELLKGNQDVFYIVGSAHMVGEEGIIKLLENRGYTVTKI